MRPLEPIKDPAYPVTSVDAALRLLLLVREGKQIRVAEAATELDVARSTAHRLLSTLQRRSFVQQDPVTKMYLAGPALVDIGLAAVGAMDIRGNLHPCLTELRDRLDETVHLVVLRQDVAMFIDGVESTRTLRTGSRVGEQHPAHAISGGKALLAELSRDQFLDVYPQAELPSVTERTLRDRDELERQLGRVRKDGYATNVGESESGVGAVAMAVRDRFDQAEAAIAVSMPLARMDDDKLTTIVSTLREVVADASHDLSVTR